MAAKLVLILLLVCGVLTEESKPSLDKLVDQASVKLLKEAIQEANGKNVVTSPLGVLILLSLYSSGTSGALRDDITRVLGGSNYIELVNSYREVSQMFQSKYGSFLTLANKVYVKEGGQLTPSFRNTAKSYNSEVEQLDFLNNENAAKTINEWAEKKTHGRIKTVITEEDIKPDTNVALINAIFFQGHWNMPFSVSNTKKRDFHVSRNVTQKKLMMSLLAPFLYYESSTLGARVVELPYKETGFSMMVVLPDKIDGLPSMVEKMAQHGLIDSVKQLEEPGVKIDVLLPKFEIESCFDLDRILINMGLKRLFKDTATGIIQGLPVVVSKAFQKAIIKVDEEGATAAAATGIIGSNRIVSVIPKHDIIFHADHPFIYAITYYDYILFLGVYQN